MTDTLNPGEAVGRLVDGSANPQQLWSADGSTRIALEASGDWRLYRGDFLWSTNTAGSGAVRAFMQRSGDLQLLDANNRVVWHTGTAGHPGAYCLLQTDGNLVVYPQGQAPGAGALWASNTNQRGGGILGAITGALGGAVQAVGGAVSSVGSDLGKVPLVGAGLEATFDLTLAEPFAVANSVVSGERLDRVALDSFSRTIASTKAVAPYAQMVVSYVPGLGTGLSAAIGAGLALASGKTVDEALLAGVAGALPGQPLSSQVFGVASHAVSSAVQGKALSDIGLDAVTNALPVPDAAKTALHAGLELAAHVVATGKIDPAWLATPALDAVRAELPAGTLGAFDAARAVGNGANVADILIQHAGTLLPPGVASALQTGLALGHAQGLQAVAATAPPARRRVLLKLPRLTAKAPAPPARKVVIPLGTMAPGYRGSAAAKAAAAASPYVQAVAVSYATGVPTRDDDPTLAASVARIRASGVDPARWGALTPDRQALCATVGFHPKAKAQGAKVAIGLGAGGLAVAAILAKFLIL